MARLPMARAMSRREQPTIEKGYEIALKRLAFADYTAQEMAVWLKRRGFSDESAQAVVLKLLERNYLNDARLCANICERWESQGGYGEKLLRHKLVQRGIAGEIVDARLKDTPVDECVLANKVFLSYLKKIKKIDEKSLPKIFRHMASRGFSYAAAARAISENKEGLALIDTNGCLDTYFKNLYN
jgi:regulatory protein